MVNGTHQVAVKTTTDPSVWAINEQLNRAVEQFEGGTGIP